MLTTRCPGLRDRLIDRVAEAARAPMAERPAAVAEALAEAATAPTLLDGLECPEDPACYCRHLLHADPAGAYAIVALVWRPGQMSPVHAHRTWCALAVHQGLLTETFYRAPEAGSEPETLAALLRRPGEGSHGPADPAKLHRIANLGCRTAVSIHVYGARYERFGQDVNLVYAA
ncbi:cysteine dioxygenase family protein [Siccirubricoccus phaeus]|uniref:cysteine dioxygenase family protein n=1 Tax=Siccirubricoccus phaeus TaxID=2595053 RepID=UPI0011F23E1D|nr:cysteine dioxygenase family protein [Siccirubricoccus phaeus]